MTIAELLVKLTAETADFRAKMAAATRPIDQFKAHIAGLGSDLTAANSRAAAFGRSMAGAMGVAAGPAGVLAAGVAAVGAVGVASATKLGRLADEIFDLSDQTGLSTDKLQQFRHVATIAGVEADALANVAIRLTSNLTSTGEESKALTGAIAKLGLSVRDSSGNLVPMDQLLPNIITKLQGMQDVTARNVAAADIFGRSWAELAPILGLGQQAFEDAIEQADKLGLVLSEDSLKAADEFRAEWSTLTSVLKAGSHEVGILVIPALTALARFALDHVVPALQSVTGWVDRMGDAWDRFRGRVPDGLDSLQEIQAELAKAEERLRRFGQDADFQLGDIGVQQRAREALGTVIALRQELAALQRQQQTLPGIEVVIPATPKFTEEIQQIRDAFSGALSEVNRLSTLLGPAFDAPRARAEAYRTAIEALVAKKVELTAVVGPQGQTLEDLALTYLQLTAGIDGANKQLEDQKALTAEVAAITEATRTPFEKWNAELTRLDVLLLQNAVSQDTYNRAVTAADRVLAEATGQTETLQRLQQEGLSLTASLRTAEEERSIALAKATELLAAGTITQETHNRAVAAAQEAYAKTTDAALTASETIHQSLANVAIQGIDAFAAFATGGKNAIHSFVESAMRDLSRLLARMLIVRGLLAAFPGSGIVRAVATAVGFPAFNSLSPAPAIVGVGGAATATAASAAAPVFDFSNFPAPSNPLAAARDADWQLFLAASNDGLAESGYRYGG